MDSKQPKTSTNTPTPSSAIDLLMELRQYLSKEDVLEIARKIGTRAINSETLEEPNASVVN